MSVFLHGRVLSFLRRRADWVGLVAACGALCCGSEDTLLPEVSTQASSSKVVLSCVSDGDCATGQCLCGVCTEQCSAEQPVCPAQVTDGVCYVPGLWPFDTHCGGRMVPGICLSSCALPEDCGEGGACVDGVCARRDFAVSAARLLNVPSPRPDRAEPSPAPVSREERERPPSLCASSPVLAAAWVLVETQSQIDSLEGCEVIDGDLLIAPTKIVTPTEDADLTPLSQLREVTGTLNIGLSTELLMLLARSRGVDPETVRATAGGIAASEQLPDQHPPAAFLSLHGLESLEHVGGLLLAGLRAEDLLPLRNLRVIGPPLADNPMRGRLSIFGSYRLETLTGLEGLEEVDAVDVSQNQLLETLVGLGGLKRIRTLAVRNNRRLRSFGGAALTAELERVVIFGNPRLRDLSPLLPVSTIGTLSISRTAIESLEGLSNIERLGQLSLTTNPELSDAAALGSLTFISSLIISGNPKLRELPPFDNLILPVPVAPEVIVTDNPLLGAGPEFPSASQLGQVVFDHNPGMLSLTGFSSAVRARSIEIVNNPALSTLALDSLEEVSNGLTVANNPSLPPESLLALSEVAAPSIKIAGNAGQALPLFDCPWLLDGTCDEASGLCAPGTDVEDCE